MAVLRRPTPTRDADSLSDIEITSPDTGAVLKFDGTNWIDTPEILIDNSGNTILSGSLDLTTNARVSSDTVSTSSTAQITLSQFSTSLHGAKFIITIYDTTATERHIVEILVTHDGVTAIGTEYGEVITSGSLATFDVDISTGNVRLLATPTSTNNMTFKVVTTQLL